MRASGRTVPSTGPFGLLPVITGFPARASLERRRLGAMLEPHWTQPEQMRRTHSIRGFPTPTWGLKFEFAQAPGRIEVLR